MSPRPLQATIGILDPTSLLGRPIAEATAAAFPEYGRRLFHTASDDEHLITEVAGEPCLVPPLADPDELDGCLAVIVTAALPPATGATLLNWLRSHPGTSLIDASQPGLAGVEASTVLAFARPQPQARARWYHIIDPSLAGPARFLAALGRMSPETAHVTVLRPASNFGADALEELAIQGAARLSGASPPALKHLPGVLAFDLAPAEEGERARLEAQLAAVVPVTQVHLEVVDAGVFHGHGATVAARCASPMGGEAARKWLRNQPGLRLARRNQRPPVSSVVDEDDVVCAELRVEGTAVSAWVMANGLRVAGPDAVVELLAAAIAT